MHGLLSRSVPLAIALFALPACQSDREARNSTHAGENPVAQMSEEEMGQRMMELATPGPEHARLARLVGTWDADVASRFDPAGDWAKSTGTFASRPVLDGRFVLQDFSSEFMGMPFQGMSLLGYDKLKGQYSSVWLDSMSTWTVTSSGQATGPDVIEYRGQMVDFITPGGRPFRSVETSIDADHWRSEMYDTINGAEVMIMKIEATRRAR